MLCSSSDLLSSLGVAFQESVENPVPPSLTDIKFKDVFPTLCSRAVSFCDKTLYQHQLDVIRLLSSGRSVALTAETGGGKTEAWLGYAMERQISQDFRALAVYPTNALSGDQVERMYNYYTQAGFNVSKTVRGKVKVFEGDLVKYDGEVGKYVRDLGRPKTVLTNPEVLKNAVEGHHKLSKFLSGLRLLVLDEFDFYGSFRATFLLHLVRRLRDRYGVNPQVVVMSATLSNPSVARPFVELEQVGGKSFRPRNVTYFLLGREEEVKRIYSSLKLEVSYQDFRRDFFKYAADPTYAKAFAGIFRENGELAERLLSEYLKCDELTIAFARGMNEANNLVGRLGVKVKYEGNAVAVHHSGVSKESRQAVEDGMRSGKVKVVVTVKTLLQGIDLGNVTRVVHVGLPYTVREFVQREGRKGRRLELPQVESVVVPTSLQDAVLLSEYSESLKEWTSLGPEAIVVSPDNEYLKLYDVVMGIDDDRRFLEEVGVDPDHLPKFRFYDNFATTVTRWVRDGNDCRELEDVTRRDLVERFQVGCVDPFNGAVVLQNVWSKSDHRWTVVESTEVMPTDCPFHVEPIQQLKDADGKYVQICKRWREEPRLEEDAKRGKLWSSVSLDLLFKGEGGFKMAKEIARKVTWYVESRGRITYPDGVSTYEVDKVDLDYTPPYWLSYDFPTYVYASELDPADSDKVEEGMNFLLAVLRLRFGLDLRTINFGVSGGGLLKVWEREPVGVLKALREGRSVELRGRALSCRSLLDEVRNVQDSNQLRMLLEYLDPYTFRRMNFNASKAVAERFVHYVCDTVPFKVEEVELLVPRNPKRRAVVLDSFLGRYAVVKEGKVTLYQDRIVASKDALKESIDLDGVVATYGHQEVDPKFSSMVVDVDREVNKLLGGPLSLAKARELLTGRRDILAEENDLSASIQEGRSEEDKLIDLFRKRAETIQLLLNLVDSLEGT
ncbi:hypothetical protein HS1genome_1727 [Sulfodiicoccus acidiphilus]|uniref:DEAD/DEAH box helicase n=1 Tax=Sulfodiicoccus acidiphilus TaxID=1670455 RepID=A0A348B586_9CREN|nr:DEAD/DEAH box helicase [Sulfodiicoccus acidiphilus]BBD73338.1 hypothetical protein HS1genome_1727 [Sulfodiicoccus acidiphilus]GGT88995.1 hypothetical protein GCM10007116_03520 [Sulfodiicoccus acidiphilus]